MKSILLALAMSFTTSAFAGPVETVGDTVSRLLTVLQNKSNSVKVSGMCQLIRARVDVQVIAQDLLGRQFGTLARDAAGIRNFTALVPSIIVTEFYGRLADSGTGFNVDPRPVPKGSNRTGVRVMIGGSQFVITVNRANNKIVDVEWRGISLVNRKKDDYQRALMVYFNRDNLHSLPVSELVRSLINAGDLIRCN
jgi:ABC-type transporter MlaC component